MKRLAAAFSFAFLASITLPAAACVDPGGIGGTGVDGGGIGGTGLQAQTEVGLLGVISAFGSICVNGIEVQYDASTPVSLNGEPAAPSQLALGQVVAVRADGSGTQARARAIEILAAAVGPASAVDASSGTLEVQGRAIRVQPTTVLGEGVASMNNLQPGQALRVSGLTAADGSLVATRIDRAQGARPLSAAGAPDLGSGRFVVQGYVNDLQPQAVRLGEITFNMPPDLAPHLQRDRLVRLAGRMEGGRRVVERADLLDRPLDIRPQRRVQPERRRDGDDRRSGRSGREERGSRADDDASGRGGRQRADRPERSDRSRSERPERIDRGGSNSGRH